MAQASPAAWPPTSSRSSEVLGLDIRLLPFPDSPAQPSLSSGHPPPGRLPPAQPAAGAPPGAPDTGARRVCAPQIARGGARAGLRARERRDHQPGVAVAGALGPARCSPAGLRPLLCLRSSLAPIAGRWPGAETSFSFLTSFVPKSWSVDLYCRLFSRLLCCGDAPQRLADWPPGLPCVSDQQWVSLRSPSGGMRGPRGPQWVPPHCVLRF